MSNGLDVPLEIATLIALETSNQNDRAALSEVSRSFYHAVHQTTPHFLERYPHVAFKVIRPRFILRRGEDGWNQAHFAHAITKVWPTYQVHIYDNNWQDSFISELHFVTENEDGLVYEGSDFPAWRLTTLRWIIMERRFSMEATTSPHHWHGYPKTMGDIPAGFAWTVNTFGTQFADSEFCFQLFNHGMQYHEEYPVLGSLGGGYNTDSFGEWFCACDVALLPPPTAREILVSVDWPEEEI